MVNKNNVLCQVITSIYQKLIPPFKNKSMQVYSNVKLIKSLNFLQK